MNLISELKNAVYPVTHAPLITFFGDSVTHGAFECPEGAAVDCIFDFDAVYHHQLQQMLLEVNPWLPVNILNAGVAGDHAAAALGRLEQDVISHRPQLCIVNFALNDVMTLSEKDYLDALREIFTRLRAAGIAPILLTPNMLNTYVHPETAERYRAFAAMTAQAQTEGRMTKRVNAARALANEMQVVVADAYAVWEEMQRQGRDVTACLSNYINHPTREMHRVFAKAIFDVLDQDIR